MHKLLIIYPHWYPSNLAGVHRARLTGNYLSEFGWKPLMLTVKSEYYEEIPDGDIHRLFSKDFEEYRVDALKVRKTRIIGDIGLRAFWQLYKKGKQIVATEKPDFLWIPIPSFYTALLGRLLHQKTGIAYGIDYIDPWVRDVSKDGSLRARLSLLVAKLMEPIAVKKASLITGVAEEYYRPVLERNFKKRNHEPRTYLQNNIPKERQGISDSLIFKSVIRNLSSVISLPHFRIFTSSHLHIPSSPHLHIFKSSHLQIHHAAFPYGFDPHDHEIEIPNLKLPWDDRPGCKPIVYAGAFMPNSQVFLDVFFKAFAALEKAGKMPSNVHLYFLGTGMYPHKRVTAYAEDHGLGNWVTEIRDRFPFLHILNFLAKADKLLIIGSTEKHYTASKTYQVILSTRPFLGMFHHESTAVEILKKTRTDEFLIQFHPERKEDDFLKDTKTTLEKFVTEPYVWNPDFTALEPYSAKHSAKILVEAIETVLAKIEINLPS